jgi:hypothetical protein
MKKKITYFFTLALSFILLVSGAQAISPATLTLTTISGDNVRVGVSGEPSSSIRLSFLPSGATTVTSITIGTTDASGNFSTSISSGGYGIPQGSPAYVTVNGMQSVTSLWPTYTSSLTLSKTSMNLAVGQSLTVTASNALILAANSLSSAIGTAITGSQIVVTGHASGSGTLSLCAINAGCNSISVTVGSQGDESSVTFSENNFRVSGSQRKEISIYGGAPDGYSITSNSNPSAVDASIRARGDLMVIYAGAVAGTAVITVCSKDVTSNCANLVVTSLSDSVTDILSFSLNDITLSTGMKQNVTVSGVSDNSYYISSNSNSGVVTATISGSIVTITGGTNSGTSIITVCSTTQNATCGSLNAALTINSTSASATTLSFSQNVVSIGKNETANITVNGGTGAGYVVSSNSNPAAASANISGSSNIIAIAGVEVGSSIISVCSSGSGSICSSIYVSVGVEMKAISFSQNNVSISSGNKTIISISGGSGTGKVISLNSNPQAVSAVLSSNSDVLILGGGTYSGTAAITVCSATYSTNCATLNATCTGAVSSSNGNTNTGSSSNTNTNTNTTTPNSSTSQTLIEKIKIEASDIVRENGINRDSALENKNAALYVDSLTKTSKNISASTVKLLINFITYGTATTKAMGAGERAGVLGSYQKAFGKLPAAESEWADAVKIANGRWPSEASSTAMEAAKKEFKKVYKREANLNNQNDNAAVSIIAYGLRPAIRNTNSESFAIKVFKSVYGHNPVSSLAWDIVRAISYSGAKR